MTTSPRDHRVELTHMVPIGAERAFGLVADVRTHPRWVPMSRGIFHSPDGSPVRAAAWRPEVGAEFTMVSGPFAPQGAPGFPDRMRITQWEPPRPDGSAGRATFLKLGPGLLGTAGIVVVPLAAHHPAAPARGAPVERCAVTWWEDVYLAGPLPRAVTAPLAARVLDGMIRVSLRRLDRIVARGR
ncbi:SRPBCC family protein [Oerskovia turbata]